MFVLKDFATALCLLLVLEGIMPFLSPARWRKMVQQLATVDDRTMRAVGFFSMLVGAGLLFILRWDWSDLFHRQRDLQVEV